jgi:hypothetical protein
VTTRRERLVDWTLGRPVVSPDGRFVAYEGRRVTLLDALAPFGSPGRDYLFICDTQTGHAYNLGMVDPVSSPQWSRDSRRFYYAELNPWKERRICSIHFDFPPSESAEGRIPWPPQRAKSTPLQDFIADWEPFSVGGVSFRYPAEELTLIDRDGVVTLEHVVDYTHRDPCAGGREVDQLTDFSLTFSVVDKSCADVMPLGARRRFVPGAYPKAVLLQCFRTVENESDCLLERWYCPIEDDKTLVVSRQHAWAPGAEDPMRDSYLELDLLDKRRADQIFWMLTNQIRPSRSY